MVNKIDKETHQQNLKNAEEVKEVSKDMMILAEKFKDLPKGQLKKILTDEIKAIFKKYGVVF